MVRETEEYCGRQPENFNAIKAVMKLMLITFDSNQIFRKTLSVSYFRKSIFLNPLNAELNPICHLLALLETHHTLHVSRIRVNVLLIYSPLLPENQKEKLSANFCN